jgi:hypothetical protein
MIIGITDRKRTLKIGVYGYANLKSKTCVTPETLFEIGSVSKSLGCGYFGTTAQAAGYRRRWSGLRHLPGPTHSGAFHSTFDEVLAGAVAWATSSIKGVSGKWLPCPVTLTQAEGWGRQKGLTVHVRLASRRRPSWTSIFSSVW